MKYIDLPECYVVRNPRVMSMSISQLAVKIYQPDWIQSQNECSTLSEEERFYPELFQSVANKVDEPVEDKPILILVRDVVEKFISVCSMLNLTAAEGLASDHPYFAPQTEAKFTKAFLYPRDIKKFLAEAKLDSIETPYVNKTENKITLTAAQKELVLSKYAEDDKLVKGL